MRRRLLNLVCASLVLGLVPTFARSEEEPPDGDSNPRRFDIFNADEDEAEEEPDPKKKRPQKPEKPPQLEPDPTEEDLEAEPEPEPEPENEPEIDTGSSAPEAPEPAGTMASTPKGPSVLALILSDDPEAWPSAFATADAAGRALAKALGLSPVAAEDRLDEGRSQRKQARIAEAIASIDRGLVFFDDRDHEQATQELDQGVNQLLAHLDGLSSPERTRLFDAMFALASAWSSEAQKELAEAIWVALLQLDPGFVPDAERYASLQLQNLESIREGLADRPRGSLKVVSNPPGARVFVDGKLRGSSPLTVSALSDGQHAVILERLGYELVATLAPVTADQANTVELDLEPSALHTKTESLSVGLAADIQKALALGRELKVERLLLLSLTVSPSRRTVGGLWLDVSKGQLLATVEDVVVVDDPEVAAEAIVRAILMPPAAGPAKEAEVSFDLLASPLFWAIVSGVVVAAGAATIAVVIDDSPRGGLAILGF